MQIIIYPSFAHISVSRFKNWHRRYTGLISFFVVPLMFGQVGLHVLQWTSPANWMWTVNAVLILAAWISTFALSVPCHHHLANVGHAPHVIRRLVRTNWIRMLAWTGVLIMDILPLLRSAGLA